MAQLIIPAQIILRARQNHLVERFRARQSALTPELLDFVYSSWTSFVQSKVAKALPETEKPAAGSEADAWSGLSARFQDKAWKQECLKRDEKFDMQFSAAVCLDAALEPDGGLLRV